MKADLLLSISLPGGAFIPFWGSASKTCILGLRKKDTDSTNKYIPHRYVFVGRSNEVGYELGKKSYIRNSKNDLTEMVYHIKSIFPGVKQTLNGGECGWINQKSICEYRIDGNYLLNKIDQEHLKEEFDLVVPLGEICSIDNEIEHVVASEEYNYLEVTDISDKTGTITNIRKVSGVELNQDSFNRFYPGDIFFTRINPRMNRVAIAPPIDGYGITSKEVFRLVIKPNNQYIREENRYILCPILRTKHVYNQIIRLSTGSSSSRARIQKTDLLSDVLIPIPNESLHKEVSQKVYNNNRDIWECSQKYLIAFSETQELLGESIDKDTLRSI